MMTLYGLLNTKKRICNIRVRDIDSDFVLEI